MWENTPETELEAQVFAIANFQRELLILVWHRGIISNNTEKNIIYTE
ncbi:MAG: hypothetical protein ACRAVC_24945 [Trichormus sp.]